MAHSLGMEVTAEGIETEQQFAILRALGCGEFQGFLLAKPMPADELPALWRRAEIAPLRRQTDVVRTGEVFSY
jgi:EAL domain-containing protein (putative c-di-GMP-specific phosphodiesterase class I)